MQSIFQKFAEGKSVAARDAEVDYWIIFFKRSFCAVDNLYDLAKRSVDFINRSTADVVQQIKVVNQYGIPTGVLDVSQAVSVQMSETNEDSENNYFEQ